MISYVNGRFVPTEEVAFPLVGDAVGTIRGFRIFTACKTVNGVVFRLDDHIKRLWDSAAQLGMELPHSQEALRLLVAETLDKNKSEPGERLIEIFYSGGPAAANGTSPTGPALVYVVVFSLKLPSSDWYDRGIVLATFPHQRLFPEIKLTFYVGAVLAHQTVVKDHNADMPLFVTEGKNPEVLEGSTFNFFVVKNGELVTPRADGRILKGITRLSVIESALRMGLVVKEESVPMDYAWDEAFIVSSTRNIVPVVRVDDKVIGSGLPGVVTQRLMGQFAVDMVITTVPLELRI
jgi:branched-chain amino acid aminotransferase